MLPIFIGLLAFGLIVILALTFGRRRTGIPTRSGVDGFWIATRGLQTGTRLRYDCIVRSSRHTGQVVVEPGPEELFVYTGNTPSDISLQVLGYGATLGNDDDDDAGVISTGGSYSTYTGSTNDTYATGTSGGGGASDDYGSSGGSADYGSSASSAESSASDAGNGFPPAY